MRSYRLSRRCAKSFRSWNSLRGRSCSASYKRLSKRGYWPNRRQRVSLCSANVPSLTQPS